MKPEVQEAYRVAMRAMESLQNAVEAAKQALPETVCIEEHADFEWTLYKMLDVVEGARKAIELERKRRIYIMCIRFAQLARTEPIRTDYVTSSPKVTYMPRLPSATNAEHRNEFQELLKYFGIPDEAVTHDLFRPHWPSFLKYTEACTAEGKPLPPGVMPERFPVYDVNHRSTKKPITE